MQGAGSMVQGAGRKEKVERGRVGCLIDKMSFYPVYNRFKAVSVGENRMNA